MDLFVREPSGGEWRLSAGLLSGLKTAIEASAEVAIRSENPADDLDEILACVWILTLAGVCPANLSLVSRCPSLGWVDAVRAAGVARVFAQQDGPAGAFSLDRALEVPREICPELHTHGRREAALSVCGRRSDRVILATHHFASRCFSQWASCDIAGRAGGNP